MQSMKELAALTALNEMMQKGWFDICVVDSVAKMMNIQKGCEKYQILHTLHCIHFAKMPAELREAIPQMIEDILGMKPAYTFTSKQKVIEVAPVVEKNDASKGGVLRLLGIK